MNLRVTSPFPAASVILKMEQSMYFGRDAHLKEVAARREREDLVLLTREMEARHQEMLRARHRTKPRATTGER